MSPAQPKSNENSLTENKNNSLSVLDDKYFADKAKIGLENLTPDDLPTPTLTLVNTSSDITNTAGQPVKHGSFYYKGTDFEAESVYVTFLSYYKAALPSYEDKTVMEKTYIVFGVIEDIDQSFKPFKMYLRRTGIGVFKQYLGQVTAMKRPMFALRCQLSTERLTNDKGKPYFKLVVRVLGVRQSAEDIMNLEEMAQQAVNKAQDENLQSNESQPARPLHAQDVQDVQPEDIPF